MAERISIPSNTPICDRNGTVSQEWRIWFNKIYNRTGGAESFSNSELKQMIEDSLSAEDLKIAQLQSKIDANSLSIANNTLLIGTTKDAINLSIAADRVRLDADEASLDLLNQFAVKGIGNVGTGTGVYRDTISNNAKFKTIKAGTGITFDNITDTDTIVINNSAVGGVAFGDIVVTGSLIGSGNTGTLFTVAGGLVWGSGKQADNNSKITVGNYTSTTNFSFLSASTSYYVFLDTYTNSITTKSNPTGTLGNANMKLLWIVDTDATKILKVTDYRSMNIFARPGVEVKALTWTAGPRADTFTFPSPQWQNQSADASLTTAVSGYFPTLVRVDLNLQCLVADNGYNAGEEVDYTTGDGVIWGKPYKYAAGTVYVYQGAQTKIWNPTTNLWVTPTAAKWALACKITLEYR